MSRILIQAGHAEPRQPGHLDQTGTRREIEFSMKMQAELANLFRRDGRFTVQTCPGLFPYPEWRGDVFLSLHLDGAGNPASHGFSLGWPANGRAPGRGPELAGRIAKRFLAIPHPGGHHADNYTDALRGYYGWSRVDAPTKVLIEHGYSTNAAEQAWMFTHVPHMARATYGAVLEHLGLKGPLEEAAGFAPPWPVFADGKQFGAGSLLNPYLIMRIAAKLRAAGKTPPYRAVVGVTEIASGKFWGLAGPNKDYISAISGFLRQGADVVIDGVVTIKTKKV